MHFTQVHPTAIIDNGASLGNGVNIWHWCHVCATASIGEGSSLGQNVYVGNKVKIGNRVKIQNNVSVYDCVDIEDDVFCGPSVVFTNVINPRSEVPRKHEYRNTFIRKGATLGANSTIVCGIEIGRYAFVAAGAVVTKDVKPFALVKGVPARQSGWMSRYGSKISLPINGMGEWVCPVTNEHYILKGRDLYLNE
jgi:UDP-2-acetamido-3-amino-2,3-dideoxy-glucuronate N-acetyltransferase